jgi:hypothetical protein
MSRLLDTHKPGRADMEQESVDQNEMIKQWFDGNQTDVTLAIIKMTRKDLVRGLQVATRLGSVIGAEKLARMFEVVADRYDV